jgi:hypothetical protein
LTADSEADPEHGNVQVRTAEELDERRAKVEAERQAKKIKVEQVSSDEGLSIDCACIVYICRTPMALRFFGRPPSCRDSSIDFS